MELLPLKGGTDVILMCIIDYPNRLKWIQRQHPENVLDIGCGDGFFSQQIEVSTGADVTGEWIYQVRQLKRPETRV